MAEHRIATQEEWQAERDELLKEEKQLTRRGGTPRGPKDRGRVGCSPPSVSSLLRARLDRQRQGLRDLRRRVVLDLGGDQRANRRDRPAARRLIPAGSGPPGRPP